MKRGIFLLCFTLILSSCAFNWVYLQPTKIPHDKKQGRMIDHAKADTTLIKIGENYQPTFTDTRNNEKSLDHTIESIVFKGSSGNLLNGWMIKPTQVKPLGITLLVMHGNAGNILSHYPGALMMVQKGFQVFMFDYSGFGFSKGKATRKNVFKDGDDALKYLIARQDVKGTKLVIYGQSLGGHLAVNIAAKNQDIIDGLVAEGAFASHDRIAKHYGGFIGPIIVREQYSGLKAIKTFRKPTLIIHSTEDDVIPFSHGTLLFANANEPKSFYQIDKSHICGPLYYADSITAKIVRMVK